LVIVRKDVYILTTINQSQPLARGAYAPKRRPIG